MSKAIAYEDAVDLLDGDHKLVQKLFIQYATLRVASRSRALGVGVLAIFAIATAQLTLITGIGASTAVLIVVAITDTLQECVRAPTGPQVSRRLR